MNFRDYLSFLPIELRNALDAEVAEADLPIALATRPISGSGPVLITDALIFMDTTAGDATVTLLPANQTQGRVLELVHTAPVNIFTIATTGSETINNLPDIQLAGDGIIRSITVVSDGTNYWIL